MVITRYHSFSTHPAACGPHTLPGLSVSILRHIAAQLGTHTSTSIAGEAPGAHVHAAPSPSLALRIQVLHATAARRQTVCSQLARMRDLRFPIFRATTDPCHWHFCSSLAQDRHKSSRSWPRLAVAYWVCPAPMSQHIGNKKCSAPPSST